MNKIIYVLIIITLFFSGCSSTSVLNPIPTIHQGTTVITEDYKYSVASGEVNSGTVWNKFGYNDDIDTATSPELIASWGGTAEDIFLSSAEILNISSTSANDISGGTGAYAVVIYGVNNNWETIIDVVNLNGTNTVQSNLAFLGVNRMAIFQSGSSLSNEGDITALASSTNEIQGQIPTVSGTSQQGLFYVEANHTFLATDLVINANKLGGGSSPKITVIGYAYATLTNARYEVFRKTIDTDVENTFLYQPTMPFVVDEEQILYFVAETDTNNALVNVRFSGILKQ